MTKKRYGPHLRRHDGLICLYLSRGRSNVPWGTYHYYTACNDMEKYRKGTRPETHDDLTCLGCVATGDTYNDENLARARRSFPRAGHAPIRQRR